MILDSRQAAFASSLGNSILVPAVLNVDAIHWIRIVIGTDERGPKYRSELCLR
jgi:hypothetical protein